MKHIYYKGVSAITPKAGTESSPVSQIDFDERWLGSRGRSGVKANNSCRRTVIGVP